MSDNAKGMLWIFASVLGATGMSLSIRGLAGAIPVVEIVFVRCVIGLAVALAAVFFLKSGPVWSERWRWHLLRSVLSVSTLALGYYSMTIMPLATATVLFFTAPLWVTVLSIPIYGEMVGWRRVSAMVAGFVGVLVVLRPSTEGIDTLALIPLASSFCFALVLLIGKRLSRTDPPEVMMVYAMSMAVLASAPFMTTEWVPPTTIGWVLLVAVAAFGTARNYADIRAYAIGEPSVLTPIQYSRLIFIAAGAYVFFQEVPDVYTIAGAGIIIASTLYIVQRESRLAREGRIKKAAAGAGP